MPRTSVRTHAFRFLLRRRRPPRRSLGVCSPHPLTLRGCADDLVRASDGLLVEKVVRTGEVRGPHIRVALRARGAGVTERRLDVPSAHRRLL